MREGSPGALEGVGTKPAAQRVRAVLKKGVRSSCMAAAEQLLGPGKPMETTIGRLSPDKME